MATPFMNLNLPVPTVTLGPVWAQQLNDALDVVDSHDHSDGKGTRVKTAGLDINADLDFNDFAAFGLKATQFGSQPSTLSGVLNAQSLHSFSGDLYFTSGAGVPVQITSGGSLAPTSASADTFARFLVPSTPNPYVINDLDNQVLYAVGTGSVRNIELPAASVVGAGRIFQVKDVLGTSEASNITISPNGLDTIDAAVNYVLNSNFGAITLASNGVDSWEIV